MRSKFFPIILLTTLFFYGASTFAAGLPKPPSPPLNQFMRPNQLSPVEIMQQKEESLAKAIKNRKKRGLPVDENNVRIVDPLYEREFEPERDYSKQSCYHMIATTDPDEFAFCDAEKCIFPDIATGYPDGGYCEIKTRDCYDRDGELILDEKGLSVTDSQHALSVKWDMCLAKDGSLVTSSGKKSFDEKIKTGCGYRVGKKIHPYLVGYIGYMMTCTKYLCIFHPPSGTSYNRETKMFTQGENVSKTPPYEYVPYLDWTCLSGKQANRVARKYRCSIVSEDVKNWGCEVCFENGKHVYRNCRYNYNEKGEIVGMRVPISDALQEQLEELERASDEFEQNPKTYHIVEAMSDIMMLLLRTPVSNVGQGGIVVLFEEFFNRRGEESWSNSKLSQELATLRARMRSAMKK